MDVSDRVKSYVAELCLRDGVFSKVAGRLAQLLDRLGSYSLLHIG